MKLTNSAIPTFHKTVVFGPAKTGKTRMVGRLAQHYKLDYLDGEKSYTTLLADSNLEPAYRENVNLFSIPDDGDNGLYFTTVYRALTTPEVKICHEHGAADCKICKAAEQFDRFSILDKTDDIVVIDSLTQLTTSCIAYITRGKPDEYKLQLDDFGKMKQYMERMFSVIQNCRRNVICITHEAVNEFEDGKKRIVPVAGSSSFAVTTSKYFDTVVYTELRGSKFVASSSPGKVPNVITASRINAATDVEGNLYTPLQLIYTKGIK